jgi:hypothetical protein
MLWHSVIAARATEKYNYLYPLCFQYLPVLFPEFTEEEPALPHVPPVAE